MKIGVLLHRIVAFRDRVSRGAGETFLEKCFGEGENPVSHLQTFVYGSSSVSRVPRDWSAKWVVNCI